MWKGALGEEDYYACYIGSKASRVVLRPQPNLEGYPTSRVPTDTSPAQYGTMGEPIQKRNASLMARTVSLMAIPDISEQWSPGPKPAFIIFGTYCNNRLKPNYCKGS